VTTPQEATPSPLEAAAMQVLHGFGAVCAAPDDEATAAAADEALEELERLLAA
jgi:hypothetical protein